MTTRLRPVLRYPGSKHGLAPWIIDRFPPHRAYVEPYFGSGAVLLAKPRSGAELVNDLDGRVVTFFRVLRDRPEELAAALALTPYARDELATAWAVPEDADELERARAFAVSCWQTRGGPTTRRRAGWRFDLHLSARQAVAATWASVPERVMAAAERLQGVAVENLDALEVIERSREGGADTLIYADPPYLGRERQRGGTAEQRRLYELEMNNGEHVAMLEALHRHPGPVVLSGYDSPLYRQQLPDWPSVAHSASSIAGGKRTEMLWLNPRAARQALLFAHEEVPSGTAG